MDSAVVVDEVLTPPRCMLKCKTVVLGQVIDCLCLPHVIAQMQLGD